jgi:adenine-specific DNA-methyltransferase
MWPGKEKWESPEPRILLEKDAYQSSKEGITDNLLIYGDNLLGLKALERDFAGKVKCVYIDPPYNTKSVFEHYNDSFEHSIWLNMMKERLVIMRKLLSEDGSIWINIDNEECHYLKVMCDEIFGRKNFGNYSDTLRH